MIDLLKEIIEHARYVVRNILEQSWGAIAGFLLGVSYTFIRSSLSSIYKKIRHRRTEREIVYLENKMGGLRVLEYGPSILIGHDSIKSVPDKFILPFPELGAAELKDDPSFTGVLSTKAEIFGSQDLAKLGEIIGVKNIELAIIPHIEAISSQFLRREHGISFNSTLYGVRAFDRLRHGPNEQPRLSLTCYETDYFTFKVMDSFHRSIVERQKNISLRSFAADSDIRTRLYPFLASIGLNFILISCDNQIILTERSRNIDRFGIKGNPIYPSFNEALASHDLPHQSGLQRIPSIPLCFRRGLSEELGLAEHEVDPPIYRLIGFGDVGIGFGVYGYARTSLTAREVISRLSGQDREFESSRIFSIPMSRRGIKKIIENSDTGLQVVALLRAMKVDYGV